MPHSAPTRSLSRKPSLQQLKKQAKELLKAYQAREQAAVIEVERFERHPDQLSFVLADAQRVLARAYGFPSWTQLKHHVDGVNAEAFIAAAEAGDVAAVRNLAKLRPELVNPDLAEFRDSALHRAVVNRDAEMTRTLMQLGADARRGIWPHRDATSAHTIAEDRRYDEIVTIIEQEEEHRRQKRSSPGVSIDSKIDDVLAAIREGRSEEAIQILERDLSLAGACNVDGATPLHAAAWAHDWKMVTWLLNRHASVDSRDALGRTPLDYAALVAGWSVNDKYYGWSVDDDHFPFLENARIEPAEFQETVRVLRSNGAELTARAAVAIGDVQAVMQLHRDGRLKNEVHFHRGGLLTIAVRVNRIDIVSLLLDLDFSPDEPATPTEDGGESWGFPLWIAAMCGRHEIAKLLLTRGADVNAVVYGCGDPLCNANATRDDAMKALLLKHGARLTVEHVAGNGDRESAKAILDGRMPAQSLNNKESSRTALAEQLLWAAASSDAEIVRMCLPYMQKQHDDPWWACVLMHATLPRSFRLILEHGIDPDVVGEGRQTTLHYVATIEEGFTFSTMLLDAGASFNRRDLLLQSTPLGWASRWGRTALVQQYLERGADALEADAEPWATPLAWATRRGHRDIVELLRLHGAR